ncbi:hypothetical protein Daura_39370 [Dactylosporangium aurantiacum]|uniref:VWA domain-containing protein n=1 Tax=Dactylosporangium aurantiacum TaxID=35754 RepID=A0A9Q9IEN2_9ACTN|nr:hypothetical protein [Dactylosporangium aurantiacum]MDG6101515.1 hypothetical protein [Dactylosporangium aurantiacum]UWZ52642.1 hypothetical protein Daura_39370 [Dactylosporangium aurantiacum]
MTVPFARHLQQHTTGLRVLRAGAVVWDDEAVHAEAYAADPQRYALSALTPGVPAPQRARVLLQLLLASRAGFGDAARDTLARVTRVLALGLAPADVLTVLLAVRRRRANHRHVTRTVLTVLLEHPHAAQLVRARRAVAQDCLEHALGRATARACAAALRRGERPHPDRLRSVLRPGNAALVPALYRHHDGTALVALPPAGGDLDLTGPRPATVTATNRGDLAATLVHLLRGGPTGELLPAVARYTDAAVAGLPRYEGTVALVLDDSASMRGYGEREWAVASQVAALRRVLDRVCARLVVVRAGGVAGRPGGATDLATAVLDALSGPVPPDVVAVASDGYENVHPGDLARVAAALPGAGVSTPVVYCQATFGHADDLTLRRPAPALPQRTFWHTDDLAPLVLWLLSHVDGPAARAWIGAELRRRLAAAEHALTLPARTSEGGPR